MTVDTILASPLTAALALVIVGAAISATAAATRLSHPRLSAWLAFFAAALPADVARMNPGAAPKPPSPPPPADPPAPGSP